MCVTDTLEHLVMYGKPINMQDFQRALGRCRSLQSLTLRADNPKRREPTYVVSMPTDPNELERPPKDDITHLRRASVDFHGFFMLKTLPELFNMPPPECLHLCCSAVDTSISFVLETIAALLLPFPAFTRLYLGRAAHRARRVQLLG